MGFPGGGVRAIHPTETALLLPAHAPHASHAPSPHVGGRWQPLERTDEFEELLEAHLPVAVQVRHEDHLIHLVVRRLLSHAL